LLNRLRMPIRSPPIASGIRAALYTGYVDQRPQS
jgi:hypothetical protein